MCDSVKCEDDSHRCNDEREQVSRNDYESRNEYLQVQTAGVEGSGDVCRHAQRHEHGEELSKVACGLEHCFDQPTDITAGVSCFPGGHERRGQGDCSAEALKKDLSAR